MRKIPAPIRQRRGVSTGGILVVGYVIGSFIVSLITLGAAPVLLYYSYKALMKPNAKSEKK